MKVLSEDHDFIHLEGGRSVGHLTAQKSWVCEVCGANLLAKWRGGGWSTRCKEDASHNAIIARKTLEWRQAHWVEEEQKAAEIWNHLPPEVQKQMRGE
jgi:hypothetical protein